jgi:hypothetical protein
MVILADSADSTPRLPDNLKTLFWECDFASLDLHQYRNFVIRRILDRGNWDAITWLRRALGDTAIKDWFLAKHGSGLDARKLRFWEVILDMPKADVDEWVRRARVSTWHGRHA